MQKNLAILADVGILTSTVRRYGDGASLFDKIFSLHTGESKDALCEADFLDGGSRQRRTSCEKHVKGAVNP